MTTLTTRWVTWSLVAVVGGILAACGDGGGGSGSAGAAYTGVTTQAAVTGSNATAVATKALQGGSGSDGLILLGVAATDSGGPGGSGGAPALRLSRVLADAVRAARLGSAESSGVAAGVAVSESLAPGNCGGSASYRGTANEGTGSFSATFTFSGWCNDGVTVSGTVTATGQADVTDPDAPVLATIELTFTVLTINDGTDALTATGTMTIDLNTDALTVSMDFRGGDGTVYRMSNFSIEVTPVGADEDVTISGRFYHPDHGYVDVTTPTPLRLVAGNAFPSSGVLLVTGSNGSSARLTALSATQFQVEVDADGDGSYDAPVGPFDWAAV